MNTFDKYPIGSYVISTNPATCIERVIAHLQGEWLGNVARGPWLGLATEIVMPKEPPFEPRAERYLEGKEVIAGEVTDKVVNIHCVSTSQFPTAVPVDEVEIIRHSHMTVMTWGTYQYLIQQVDMGDPQVGIGGGAVVFGTGGFAIDGYPELLIAELYELQHDPTSWIQQPHLFAVVNWLTETAPCPNCGQRDYLNPLNDLCRKCEAKEKSDDTRQGPGCNQALLEGARV